MVYYAIARDHAREDIGTFLIHNGHMVIWEQEEEDLYQTALMNMRADGEADLIMIERIVEHILGIPFQEKHYIGNYLI